MAVFCVHTYFQSVVLPCPLEAEEETCKIRKFAVISTGDTVIWSCKQTLMVQTYYFYGTNCSCYSNGNVFVTFHKQKQFALDALGVNRIA